MKQPEHRHILIIEDNLNDAELCKRLLKSHDDTKYNFFHAQSGNLGLEMLENITPDCLLLDYSLPGKNGLTILKKIKEKHPQLPVIILSGQGSDAIAAQLIKAGAYDYIVKASINAKRLHESITNAINQAQQIKKQLDESLASPVILIVDDNPEDRELCVRTLRKNEFPKYQYCEAESGDQMYEYINNNEIPDCILLDYSLPGHNGLYLLKELRILSPFIPIIMTTGQGDEKVAVEAIREGADDYIVKSLVNVDSLNKAVSSAIMKRRLEKTLAEQESELNKSDALNKAIMANSSHLIITCDPTGLITSFSPSAEKALGYKASEVIGKKTPAIWHDEAEITKKATELSEELGETVAPGYHALIIKCKKFGSISDEWTYIRKDGSRFPVNLTLSCMRNKNDQIIGYLGVVEDITKRKKSEAELKNAHLLQELILKNNPDLVFVKDEDFKIMHANPAFMGLYPQSQQNQIIGYTTLEGYKEEEAKEFLKHDRIAFEEGYSETYETIKFPNGQIRNLLTRKIRFYNADQEAFILGIATDVTEQRKEEKMLNDIYLITVNEMFNHSEKMQRVLEAGTQYFGLELGIISEINNNSYKILHAFPAVEPGETFTLDNSYCSHTFGTNEVKSWHNAAESEIAHHPCYQNLKLNTYIGTTIYVEEKPYGTLNFTSKAPQSTPFSQKQRSFINLISQWVGFELTRLKNEKEKENFIDKLTTSNEELERFAFVCSHDLQEPLRMIRSFSEKLQIHLQSYIENDEKGKKYFHFVTEGATQAQNLIADILTYSSIDGDTVALEQVDLLEIIHVIKKNMHLNITERKATITYDKLPKITGNKTQLFQLFQNLINNGLKYQSPEATPNIHIGVKSTGEHWEFSIQDNGIGMEDKHLKKIFDVFQRLHRKSQYAGTGVGLSICKKVVERHGGKIWVESQKGVGSTFYFTLSKPETMEVYGEHRYQAS